MATMRWHVLVWVELDLRTMSSLVHACRAAEKGSVSAAGVLVDALTAASVDVHVADADGSSAAQLAAGKGHVEVSTSASR